ncbi:polysaccharide pyruvyl transferase family protein [Stutzerimonas nitrititolerans]|uniref:polysaccharide pyruvyl transferase family protein n=1 Tax=Stutzerimonas nitrititolerans TaxID=2482751 RepID=UPI001BDD1EE9|nr:polysaccharide pyruvyl transferase family protein [Stutzerimonas nitrititolerans]MBT1120883.1 polysaccharide pyruvyl transferase family protein [Stutzerimonas nitrititolerans]
MNQTKSHDTRPTLIGYLPPLEGIRKTGANYQSHSQFINIGDIAYAHAGALLTSGRNFDVWNFRMSADEVNENFSKVVFFIPCRIAPPPYDQDGYPYAFATDFIERLKIPFFSLGESIQTRHYEYESNFHNLLSAEVVRYLSVIADKSPLVGTRGEYSAEVLNKLGIKNAMPLGCPSLYLNGLSLPASLQQVPAEPRRVAVCYSNYQSNAHSRIDDVLRLADQCDYHYVEQTFGLVTQALYYPGKISGADIQAARSFYRDLTPLLSLLEKGLVRYFTNYTLWKDFLSSVDFAFGARMHGLTPAIHAGKPAVFIAHDARVREMCEFFSLPFVSEGELPRQLSLSFFLSHCNYSAASARYRQAYSQFVATLHRYGIGENIGAGGEIIDSWTPIPDPRVVWEEGSVRYTSEEMSILQRQIALGREIPDEVFSKLAQIKNLGHDWYLSRLDRAK